MLYLTSESEIANLASRITSNSEYGDETISVVAELTSLWADAVNFGTRFTRRISDCWGGKVTVTAVPEIRRNSWVF